MRIGYREDPETGDFPGERVFASKVDRQVRAAGCDGPPRHARRRVFRGAATRTTTALSLAEAPQRVSLSSSFSFSTTTGLGEPLPQPNWYLGRGRRFVAAESICDLIDRTASELGVDRGNVITVGSSMGGWAALYFGARVGAGDAIVGEPQTLLGSYLCGPAFHTLAEHIAGGSSPEDSDFLDAILFDAFRAAPEQMRTER